jgi:hypothetical protein
VDEEVHRTSSINHAHTIWRNHHRMLLFWHQSALSSEILSRVLGSARAYELWDHLSNYFHKQTRAIARHLRVEHRAKTLEDSSIQEYLLRICQTIDVLISIGNCS